MHKGPMSPLIAFQPMVTLYAGVYSALRAVVYSHPKVKP